MNNLATVQPITPFKDGDGGEDAEDLTFEVSIHVVDNGFIFTRHADGNSGQKVFLFDGLGNSGPLALIEEVIHSLGLSSKVKLQK
jgi:hypothetical protein